MDLKGNIIAEATHELARYTRQHIEKETAWKWAARAVAAYANFVASGEQRWLRDSESYYTEAVEHAALADDTGDVLRVVRGWIRQYVPGNAL